MDKGSCQGAGECACKPPSFLKQAKEIYAMADIPAFLSEVGYGSSWARL
jgi:hypothetical protein